MTAAYASVAADGYPVHPYGLANEAPDELSPRQALDLLYRLKQLL